jgi:ferritin-like metal-binding protein YciE
MQRLPKLIHASESHLKETEEHVTRLKKYLNLCLKAVAKKCDAMAGLEEAEGLSKKPVEMFVMPQ